MALLTEATWRKPKRYVHFPQTSSRISWAWSATTGALPETRGLRRLDHFHSHSHSHTHTVTPELVATGAPAMVGPLQSAGSASRRKAATHMKVGVGEEIPGCGTDAWRRDGILGHSVVPVLPEDLHRGDAEGERGLQRTGSPTLGEEGEWSGKAGGRGGQVAFRFCRRRVPPAGSRRKTLDTDRVRTREGKLDRVGRANWSFDPS